MEMKVVAPIRVGDMSLARYRPGQGCRGLPADFMRLALPDPAAAFSGVYLHFEQQPDGHHDLSVEQGYEMGRPSLIGLSVTVRDQRLAAAAIDGDAIVVSKGKIEA